MPPQQRGPHPATLTQRQGSPHPATIQRSQGRAPHAATLAAQRPPHPATVAQRHPARGDVAARWPRAIQLARANATMVNLHGAQLAKQDELAWCYASVISVVTAYLNNGAGWTPCQIASWAVNNNRFGGEADQHTLADVCNCCKASNKRSAYCKGVEAVSPLATVMNHLNVTYTSTKGNLSWPTLQAEVDAGRPILLAFVRNDNKPGHVAMIVGYEQLPHDPTHPERGSTAYAIVFDPAGQNTAFNDTLDNATWTLRVKLIDLLSAYPMGNGKWSIGSYYTNLQQNPALPAAPAWAVFA
jgi:hypothetical protein